MFPAIKNNSSQILKQESIEQNPKEAKFFSGKVKAVGNTSAMSFDYETSRSSGRSLPARVLAERNFIGKEKSITLQREYKHAAGPFSFLNTTLQEGGSLSDSPGLAKTNTEFLDALSAMNRFEGVSYRGDMMTKARIINFLNIIKKTNTLNEEQKSSPEEAILVVSPSYIATSKNRSAAVGNFAEGYNKERIDFYEYVASEFISSPSTKELISNINKKIETVKMLPKEREVAKKYEGYLKFAHEKENHVPVLLKIVGHGYGRNLEVDGGYDEEEVLYPPNSAFFVSGLERKTGAIMLIDAIGFFEKMITESETISELLSSIHENMPGRVFNMP